MVLNTLLGVIYVSHVSDISCGLYNVLLQLVERKMARTIARKPLKKNFLLLRVLYVSSGRNLGYVFTKKLLEGETQALVRLFIIVEAQATQAQCSNLHTWCMGQLVYIENCMGKSPIVKKMCK